MCTRGKWRKGRREKSQRAQRKKGGRILGSALAMKEEGKEGRKEGRGRQGAIFQDLRPPVFFLSFPFLFFLCVCLAGCECSSGGRRGKCTTTCTPKAQNGKGAAYFVLVEVGHKVSHFLYLFSSGRPAFPPSLRCRRAATSISPSPWGPGTETRCTGSSASRSLSSCKDL